MTYRTTYNTKLWFHLISFSLTLFKLSDTIISLLHTFLLSFSFSLLLQIPSPLSFYKYSTRRAPSQEKLERESRARKYWNPPSPFSFCFGTSRSVPRNLWQVRAPSPSHFSHFQHGFSVQFTAPCDCDVFHVCVFLMNSWFFMYPPFNSMFRCSGIVDLFGSRSFGRVLLQLLGSPSCLRSAESWFFSYFSSSMKRNLRSLSTSMPSFPKF